MRTPQLSSLGALSETCALHFKQALSASAILAYLAWDNFGKPIWTVNVERWAEQRNLDQTLNENVQQISVSVMPGWVI